MPVPVFFKPCLNPDFAIGKCVTNGAVNERQGAPTHVSAFRAAAC